MKFQVTLERKFSGVESHVVDVEAISEAAAIRKAKKSDQLWNQDNITYKRLKVTVAAEVKE